MAVAKLISHVFVHAGGHKVQKIDKVETRMLGTHLTVELSDDMQNLPSCASASSDPGRVA